MVKTIIFDLDGTLIDSSRSIADSFNAILTNNTLDAKPLEFYKKFLGSSVDTFVENLLSEEQKGDTEFVKNFTEESLKFYSNKLKNEKLAAYEGIEQMLEELKAKGIKLAINTRTDQGALEKIVRNTFKENTFDCIVGAMDGMEPKPSADGVKYIIDKLHEAGEILYVGDADVDINTVNAAREQGIDNIRAVLATWDRNNITIKPDVTIDKPSGLVEYVEMNNKIEQDLG